ALASKEAATLALTKAEGLAPASEVPAAKRDQSFTIEGEEKFFSELQTTERTTAERAASTGIKNRLEEVTARRFSGREAEIERWLKKAADYQKTIMDRL
ncbi:unnamed protein product, partial [Prorocentrum cordatum]